MESDRTSQEKGTDFQLVASSDDEFACGYKDCKVCGDTKPLKEFWVEANGVGGRKSTCKACSGTRTIKSPPKKGKISNDRIQKALEAAAYRIIKESM